MAHFVQEYVVLRWLVVGAFLVAAGIVIGRLATPVRGGPAGIAPAGRPALGAGAVARGGLHVVRPDQVDEESRRQGAGPSAATQQESDAAHLLMCLVMLAMLVFPAEANPDAVRGVLVAMTVVFAALLVSRIVEGRSGSREQPVALGYHVLAAAAMLYAMSGHTAAGHGGPAPLVAYALAALFCADALAVLATGGRHRLGHPAGSVLSTALVPHLVMDLGTAYMLVGAVAG
ncbi:DUF5134 domain-containing protein [Nocardia sp. NPDC127579]|uniref:DUF5134 domain-containing protein n=1 Tax=Nocardia sp. NPDC127579 TaxID=3345402 RepID=UPI0036407469